jgi:type VI secretion system Hcp family effector
MGIYLKLGDIHSDATGHKDRIACESISGSTTRPMYTETGAGKLREASTAECLEVVVRMKIHKASPRVFKASLKGHAAKTAEIDVIRDSDGHQFLKMILHDVFVSRYALVYGDNGAAELPMEEIYLNYTKIELHYHPTRPDGKPGTKAPKVGFDMATGKKL